ncbi:MAG: 4-hydroxybenzoate octaprenyltransferase, partial [Planctomycetota bacterium]|nr:4-hydroxybenzoate octaprenyltransferase [Planctomycetota bacterium]
LLFGIFAIVVDDMGWAYLAGVVLAAVLLAYEHCLIDPDDLSKMNTAFFTMNGLVSITLLGCTLIDLYVL